MDRFIFSQRTETWFGDGIMEEALVTRLRDCGERIMLGYGHASAMQNGTYGRIRSILEGLGKTVVDFGGIMPNPGYSKVLEGAALAREHKIDFILAVGGGSVSDCCKIVAAQALMEEDIWRMETEEGRLPERSIPLGVVVTAAGTGSEQNDDAVITNEELHIKRDLYGHAPVFAVLDPTLTESVPMLQLMSGAFDSLSHVMESYFGKPQSTFITDELSEAVMRSIIRNMRRLRNDPGDKSARAQLMWGSAIAETGLLKLGKTGDFQCHMIEHQIGAYTGCSHGQGLAVLHPVVYRHLLKDNAPKFRRFASEVWGLDCTGLGDMEAGEKGIDALADFISETGLPGTFTQMGIMDMMSLETMRKIAHSTIVTKGCARQLSPIEILHILKECV